MAGLVFDVAEGREFYGPSGPYHCFAGTACTNALTIGSLADEDRNDEVTAFTLDDLEEMRGLLHEVYLAKYSVVGHLQSWLDTHGCVGDDAIEILEAAITAHTEL